MSNTYFEIEKEMEYKGLRNSDTYTNQYRLVLTAFVSKDDLVQLTVTTNSTIQGQSGTGYISLDDKEIDSLILGLIERRSFRVSATGDEKSAYCPPKD